MYDLEEYAFANEEHSGRHKKLVGRIGNMSLGKRDPVLFMLIVSTILYTPDFVDLDHPGDAERIQMAYAFMLCKSV